MINMDPRERRNIDRIYDQHEVSVFQKLKPIFLLAMTCIAIVTIAILFLTVQSMRQEINQLHQVIQKSNSVCGLSYTHSGTPVVLKSQVEYSVDLNGNIYKSTSCN